VWIRTIATGLVDTTTPTLRHAPTAGQLGVAPCRFGFHEFIAAYDTFSDPASTATLKVPVSRR
jgi:hypothetical protein